MNSENPRIEEETVFKLLILSSNPRRDLNLEREFSDLTSAVRRLGKFEVEYRLGIRAQELPQQLAEHNPQFVHFSGHGAGAQGLVFQDEDGQEQLVSTEVLARLFEVFTDKVNCVVLNACDSDHQAKAIVEHINYVVGMSQPIMDQAAHTFSVGFYEGLAEGRSIDQAYELGCIAIQIWSEGKLRFSLSKQPRKAEYVGETAQSMKPDMPEHMKPVLRKRCLLRSAGSSDKAIAPSLELSDTLPDIPPGFKEVVLQEAERKDYKDEARTAYDNFGQFSTKQATQLTKSDYAQRRILLDKVESFWIEGLLKPSIQSDAAISLELRDRPEVIADLSEGIEALLVQLDDSFDELHKTQIYEEMGQGRTLLILGEPGSGKTIAILQLAQRLTERSEQNLALPIPVVFNLSSWAKARKPVVDWLIDELREHYQVPKVLSKSWLQQQQLILLLDGLDEVKAEHRNACVGALNEFIGLFPQTEVAVCSRVRDYEALDDRLQISSALCLQPLSSKQIYQFLDSVGGSLLGLKMLLSNNVEIEQFARTPLILSLMSVAYQGWSVERLIPQLCSASERRKHLLDTYIEKRIAQGATSEYSKRQVLRWLSWLASRMVREKQTIFLIERIQPSWLQSKTQRLRYRLESSLIGWLSCCLGIGLAYVPSEGLIGGLIAGSDIGLVCGLIFAIRGDIQPIETLKWSWGAAVRSLFAGIVYGFIVGFAAWLILGPIFVVYLVRYSEFNTGSLSVSEAMFMVPFGAIVVGIGGSLIGSVFGLVGGLRGSEMQQRTKPNQGIWQSARNACVLALIGGLVDGLLTAVAGELGNSLSGELSSGLPGALDNGLSVIHRGALIGGLIGGGSACLRHFSLRLMLRRIGYAPWNYAEFLDFASERRLTRKVGGGYVFFHRMLLEHFARMDRSQKPSNSRVLD